MITNLTALQLSNIDLKVSNNEVFIQVPVELIDDVSNQSRSFEYLNLVIAKDYSCVIDAVKAKMSKKNKSIEILIPLRP